MVLEGHEAVTAARQVIGATNPLEAAPGSIRGDHGLEVQTNLVHGSDSAGVRHARDRALLPRPLSGAGPRLPLAAAAGDPRAARDRVPGGGAGRRGADARAIRARSWSRTRGARRARWRASSCSGRTPRSCSTAACSASRPTRRRRRASCAALSGPHPRGARRHLPARGRRGARGARRDQVRFRRARAAGPRLVPGDRRVARAGRRLRDPGHGGGPRRRDRGRLLERGRTAVALAGAGVARDFADRRCQILSAETCLGGRG